MPNLDKKIENTYVKINTKKFPEENKEKIIKNNSFKLYKRVISYLLFFLIPGIIYVNSIIDKRETLSELEKLKLEKKNQENLYVKLKIELMDKTNLKNIENIAKKDLNMEISEEINYLIIKK